MLGREEGQGQDDPATEQRTITEDTEATGRTVRASGEEPQYEVESDTSGRTAGHKPAALHRK